MQEQKPSTIRMWLRIRIPPPTIVNPLENTTTKSNEVPGKHPPLMQEHTQICVSPSCCKHDREKTSKGTHTFLIEWKPGRCFSSQGHKL